MKVFAPAVVSVVIRAKDREHTIRAAIESVLAQVVPCEVIVVDSGSSDRTVEIARTMGARVIEIPAEDFTYGGAINIGVREAAAPVVLILSSHCVLPGPGWVAEALQIFADERVAGVNGFVPSSQSADVSPLRETELALELGATSHVLVQDSPWFGFAGFSNHASMIRRSVALEHPFDEAMVACEDKEWANRVVAAGHRIVYSPRLAVSGKHRRREGARLLFARARRESAALSRMAGQPAWSPRHSVRYAVRVARSRRGLRRLAPLRPASLVETLGRMAGARDIARTGTVAFSRGHAQMLGRLVGPIESQRVDLLNFPLHNNCGDSAIWLGERALLRSLGVPDRKVRAFTNILNQFEVRRPAPVALIRGGGYFGDLWPDEFRAVIDACRQYRGSRLVLMPQTVTEMSDSTLQAARRSIAVHGDVTILLRDQRSVDLICERIPEARVHLAPDAAECLSRSDLLRLMDGPARPSQVRVIARTDAEGDGSLAALACGRGIEVLDFVDSRSVAANRALRELHEIVRARSPRGVGRALLCGALARSGQLDRHARRELARAVAMLAGASHIVTDRLHVCILASILGVRVTAVDTGYGKLAGYFSAWPSPLVTIVSDADAALREVPTVGVGANS